MKFGTLDIERLNRQVEDRYIVKKKHPVADLWIYNYAQKTQYESYWNNETLQCRGLIMTENQKVVARSLPKFFNLSEVGVNNLPNLPFEVYEKLDGSLGVMYWIDQEPFIATRGSFNSKQAKVANRLLKTKYAGVLEKLDQEKTYVFEIIYPANRIVVDYGSEEKLVLIAIIDTETGNEAPLTDLGFPLPERYHGYTHPDELLKLSWTNHEGFVLRFSNGFRVKVKMSEYIKLHKIITQVSSLSIWEALRSNQPIVDYIEQIPDEFYGWVRKTVAELEEQYAAIERLAKAEYQTFKTDKETALYFQSCTYPSVLFAIWNKKNYAPLIWRYIRPEFEKAFTNEEKGEE